MSAAARNCDAHILIMYVRLVGQLSLNHLAVQASDVGDGLILRADSLAGASVGVVALALSGVDAVKVVRQMCGVTNGREAAPGTIRGDLSMSNQQNIVHASDSVENAAIELRRFFRPEEIFEYQSGVVGFVYGDGEC